MHVYETLVEDDAEHWPDAYEEDLVHKREQLLSRLDYDIEFARRRNRPTAC